MGTALTDPVVSSETWRVSFRSGLSLAVVVDRHRGDAGDWYYAHAASWPRLSHALHFSGDTAAHAVERLVAGAICSADEAVGVVAILAPSEVAEVTRLREENAHLTRELDAREVSGE